MDYTADKRRLTKAYRTGKIDKYRYLSMLDEKKNKEKEKCIKCTTTNAVPHNENLCLVCSQKLGLTMEQMCILAKKKWDKIPNETLYAIFWRLNETNDPELINARETLHFYLNHK
jgi:hypothetical protein